MALYPFTVNNQTFNESDFAGMAYYTIGLPQSIEAQLRNATRLSHGITANSPSIGSGGKAFTGLSGLLVSVGDYVIAYLSSGNWMAGVVNSYNPSTGVMTITSDAFAGTGSGQMKVTVFGERTKLASSNPCPLPPWLGGTGAGGTFSRPGSLGCDNQFGSSIGGMGASPWDAMVEVFDDFEAFELPTTMTSSGSQPDGALASPWSLVGSSSSVHLTTLSLYPEMFGVINFAVPTNPSRASAVMKYGEVGFLACGAGAVNYDTYLRMARIPTGLSNDTNVTYRIGLRGQGSGSTTNIFSYSGIGFELRNENAGKLNTFVAVNGTAYRQILPVYAKAAEFIHLGFSVGADGNFVRFMVNGTIMHEQKINLVSDNVNNLLHPAFEISSSISDYMEIDAVWLRKNLSR
jgi:hypothetical protein